MRQKHVSLTPAEQLDVNAELRVWKHDVYRRAYDYDNFAAYFQRGASRAWWWESVPVYWDNEIQTVYLIIGCKGRWCFKQRLVEKSEYFAAFFARWFRHLRNGDSCVVHILHDVVDDRTADVLLAYFAFSLEKLSDFRRESPLAIEGVVDLADYLCVRELIEMRREPWRSG